MNIVTLQLNWLHRYFSLLALLLLVFVGLVSPVYAAGITVTPITWDILGLDSNSPTTGPRLFPVGARVCNTSGTALTDVLVKFNWDSVNTNIDLRAGSLTEITFANMAAGACRDAYFEVEVTTTAAAYDTFRRYYITAQDANGTGTFTGSTPRPRQLYVEYLISQNRNATLDVLYGTSIGSLTSVPAGGAMNLMVGETYYIRLHASTATQGYEQLETFITLNNKIFNVLDVTSSYSANTAPLTRVPNPNDKLYADACKWDPNPSSPTYSSCLESSLKSGGSNIFVTYHVTILSGSGATSSTLNSLIYDFSGSSFHYNSDYSSGARTANIIDPTLMDISKAFTPATTVAGGISTLTFTLTNPNSGAVSGYNFSDTLPGSMTIANPANATTNGCGTPTLVATAGTNVINFSNGTVAGATVAGAGTCTISVNVTAPAGTWNNISNNLFINTVDTTQNATASLTVNAAPTPVTTCSTTQTFANWQFSSTLSDTNPLPTTSTVTATASTGSGFTATNLYINTTAGNNQAGSPAGSWEADLVSTSATLNTALGEYFEFSIDTTGVSSISLSFFAQRTSQGPASAQLYYGTSGQTASSVYTITGSYPGTAFTAGPITTGLNPSGPTLFRLYAYNAGQEVNGHSIYLDNVTFTGCKPPDPPRITKAFSPNPIAVGGTSTLTFTLTNPNTTAALSGVTFNDTLPAGMAVTSSPTTTNTCGGSWAPSGGATALSFSGGSMAANSTISATDVGTNSTATGSANATLNVISAPEIDKSFSPNTVVAGGTTTLVFSIVNPNASTSISGVAFTDNLPSGLTVATTPNTSISAACGSPTFSASGSSISFSGGTLAGGATCTVKVDVTVAVSPAPTTYTNANVTVAHTVNGTPVNGNTTSDTLNVTEPNPSVSLSKEIGLSSSGPWYSYVSIPANTAVFYRFVVENTGDVPLTGIAINDPNVSTASCTWPSPLPVAVAANDNHIATCVVNAGATSGGTLTNTATASGSYSALTVTATDSAKYATAELSIVKSVAQTQYTFAGETLSYSYVVTNTGTATLSGPVTVSDDKATVTCPDLTTIGNTDDFFNAGESLTCTAAYVVTPGDVSAGSLTNTASASAGGFTSPTDSITIANTPLPNLIISKTNNAAVNPVNPGAWLWTLTITNDLTASGAAQFTTGTVLLTDTLPAGPTYSVNTAPPNVDCQIAANVLTCTATADFPLGAGGGTLVITLNVTNASDGTYPNTAVVDPNDAIPETRENDNQSPTNTVVVDPSPYGIITGVVYNDLNHDGNYDSGEELPNVSVTITGDGGPYVLTTNSSGVYIQTNLNPGDYSVDIDLTDLDIPTGATLTIGTDPTTATAVANTTTTVDFGFTPPGSISGVVYYDANGNGTMDGGEQVLAVPLTITGPGGTYNASTDGGGAYSVANLPPGNYSVDIDTAYVQTIFPGATLSFGSDPTSVTVSSGNNATADFGFSPPGSISGVVFNDLNGNGVHDTGEGIPDITVTITGTSGGPMVLITNASGAYSQIGLAADTYSVDVDTTDADLPAGAVLTYGSDPTSVVLPAGGSEAVDFGFVVPPGTISGYVFNDLNDDGNYDVGEGIADVTVTITGTGGPYTLTTGADGSYTQSGLVPGSYSVDVNTADPDIPTGATFSIGTDPTTVTVTSGGTATADFGFTPPGTISGYVYQDLNGNNAYDAGEGLPNVTVTITGTGGPYTLTTGADGRFSQSGLVPGDYDVDVNTADPDIPAGATFSIGTDPVTVTVLPNATATAEFGFTPPGSLSGVVFQDLNGNNAFDAGEGLSGVPVTINGPSGTFNLTTNATGGYSQTGLASGSYTVDVDQTDPAIPSGAALTVGTDPATVTVPANGSGTANFGYTPPGSLSGTVFNDLNDDGNYDAGEGLVNVTVTITGTGGPYTLITDANGGYSQTGLIPGSYSVNVDETDADIPTGAVLSIGTDPATVTVPINGNATADFGFTPPGTISGVVYQDLNANSAYDVGEGLPNVTVTINGAGGPYVLTTDVNGGYSQSDLAAGIYSVDVNEADTDIPTVAVLSIGTDPASVTVPPNGSATANFGFTPPGSVSGTVFNDLNGSGTYDLGEGLPNVTVTVLGSGGPYILTTDVNGGYSQTGLPVGTYSVDIDLTDADIPSGATLTTGTDPTSVSVPPNGNATADFGFTPPGSISGIVYVDLNGNNTHDAGEGLPNVTVTITGPGGPYTLTTNASGVYTQIGVSAGDYVVTVDTADTDIPTGATFSLGTNPANVTVPSGGSGSADFGFAAPGSLGGVVYIDNNGNAGYDSGEELANISVTITGPSGTFNLTTNSSGVYSQSNLTPGSYTVDIDLTDTDIPVGATLTIGSDPTTVSVPANGSATVDFGFTPTGGIGGIVFHDINGNGIHDPGEGLPNITVTIDGPGGRYTLTTNASGAYSQLGLPVGSYTVTVDTADPDLPPSAALTIGTSPASITLTGGDSGMADFGFTTQPGTISGVVFNDLNGDGTFDAGEQLANISITITGPGGPYSLTTDANGQYSISGLPPGSYDVDVDELDPDLPAGVVLSVGTDPATVTLAPNGSATADFGFVLPPGSITGTVFNDVNANGVQDPGEEPIAGVTVFIDLDDNGVQDPGEPSTVSALVGGFSFRGLSAGIYRVRMIQPAGMNLTLPAVVDVTVSTTGPGVAVFGLTSSAPVVQPPPTPVVIITDPLITKSVNPPFSMPGESAQWTIVVTNPGSVPYGAVQTVDNMPAEVEIVNVNATAGTISFSGQTVTWNIGSLAPLQSVTITINARVRANVAVPFTITNVAVLTGDNLAQTTASATLISVAELPATGEAPLAPLRWVVVIGTLLLILGGGFTLWRHRRQTT
ncbi:MAG: DUF11 domain-containing protein [Chloroflexi bacterium]|uniref:SdrD B-like domain-containing protein n=1 Tax=Candidatus Flexifilum breve TaxID=3140694 RepID=UPI003136C0EA|nr:DUF11 domain-containing protein [Chloroflexota bacterium]